MPILNLGWLARKAIRLARWGVTALVLLGAAQVRGGTPAAEISSEYQLKAVFLFNFAQFVEWPKQAFGDETAPIIIAVAGNDPFGAYLDELVAGEKVAGRPIVIRRFGSGAPIGDCHILFVSSSETRRLDRVLSALAGRHVLTVSDIDGFAREGGMVRFVLTGGKIRLRVNLDAARAAELVISSKVLRPATIVTTGRD